MTKKFDDLNDTFNVTGEIVSQEVEKIEPAKEKPDISKDEIGRAHV